MGDKKNKKNDELPGLPKKYINERKIEESEKNLIEEKQRNEKLLAKIKQLQSEIHSKETENVKSILANDYKIEEFQNLIKVYDNANEKLKLQLETIRDELCTSYNNIIADLKKEYEDKIEKLKIECESERAKCEENKNKKKEYKNEVNNLKDERSRLNDALLCTIKKKDDEISSIKIKYETIISDYKKREEIFLKERETLSENEIFGVYKELKNRFEKNLLELKEFKETNNKINEDNKLFKLTMNCSDKLLNECAKIQIQKQTLISKYKETIENQYAEIEKMSKVFDSSKNDLIEQYNLIIKSNTEELHKLKTSNSELKAENKKLKALSQMILDQRSEVEMFFIESLEDVKQELYKKKKQEQRKKSLFPSISNKYSKPIEEMNKMTIKDLSVEDKEKMLKLLFSKINVNSKPKGYKDFSNDQFFDKITAKKDEKKDNVEKKFVKKDKENISDIEEMENNFEIIYYND